MAEKEKNIRLEEEKKLQQVQSNIVKTKMQQYIVVEQSSQPALFLCIKKVCVFATTHTISAEQRDLIVHLFCNYIIAYIFGFVKQIFCNLSRANRGIHPYEYMVQPLKNGRTQFSPTTFAIIFINFNILFMIRYLAFSLTIL